MAWLRETTPGAFAFEQVDVGVMRLYRAYLAERPSRNGGRLQPATILDSQRALSTFFHWARSGYPVDPRILELKRPRVRDKEPDVDHIAQLRQILAAYNPTVPQEEMAVRILVGSGVRVSELCGLAAEGPDGLPDLMLDSLGRGRVELRVRWDHGAKGRKSRRVPVTPRLAAAIKRYEARHRQATESTALLVGRLGEPYDRWGIDTMMDRLKRRTGLRVHAHAFRHTFATVATNLG